MSARRKHSVLVLTPAIFNDALSRAFVTLEDVQLLVFDEAHHCRKRHTYAQIMAKYRATAPAARPRIFGMTASPVNLKLSTDEAAARAAITLQARRLRTPSASASALPAARQLLAVCALRGDIAVSGRL